VAGRTRFDAVVMGWSTYAVGLPVGLTSPYPHLDQVVVTRAHADHPFLEGVRTTADAVGEVQRMKRQDGVGIWLCGGGALAGALADEIDELVLKVNPIVLGDGVPLVAGGPGLRAFTLVDSTPYRSGVVVNRYRRTT
jgi:dihydrofolate reductase